MFGRLPLSALRAFEATARRGAPAYAAAELFVTPGAVTRQIRQLEDQLSRRLFDRGPEGWRLTPAGTELAREVGAALHRLRDSCDRVVAEDVQTLKVGVPRAFAAHVIAPRLSRFLDGRGPLQVQLDGDRQAENPAEGGLDAVVRYGLPERPPGTELRLLPPARVFPVCAPALAARASDPAAWSELTFLAFEPVDYWAWWSAAAGVPVRPRRVVRFSESSMIYEAARAGVGLAIGHSYMNRDMLADGRLVAVGPEAEDERRYFVLTPTSTRSPLAEAFAAWLERETAGF